jgi:putative pyruvate formate lyase activating enzyme
MTEGFKPAYLALDESGELSRRARELSSRLSSCDQCPRECGVDRTAGEVGECQTGANAEVSSFGPHHGEEAPLVGSRGSGTIFFTHCNLCCQFCQNYDISQAGHGDEVLPKAIASMMMELQAMGCHNVNFVSPTHVVAQIVEALDIAVEAGLRLPLVYNTGGYDSVETLRVLDGIVDIYMPDAKYSDDDAGFKYSGVKDYWKVNRAALKEMHRQVGDLVIDERGVARRGLLVRHLVLPEGKAGSREVLRFLATEISKSTYVNIMDQYRPCYNAGTFPELSRGPTVGEMEQVFRWAAEEGLNRLDERPRRGRIVLPW